MENPATRGNPMTMAQRREAAKAFVCPKCHAESGAKCKSMSPRFGNGLGTPVPAKRMKGAHTERLAKVQP